ncbi:hypothetical protein B0I37DRAFT_160091 [Chaetomium sp. MPI-CAGE-AT-0009]|nr:hypothetical protein B0I37DRAFT_160091 [Chaetomium sp. MPI-CAGE-AT-0009]
MQPTLLLLALATAAAALPLGSLPRDNQLPAPRAVDNGPQDADVARRDNGMPAPPFDTPQVVDIPQDEEDNDEEDDEENQLARRENPMPITPFDGEDDAEAGDVDVTDGVEEDEDDDHLARRDNAITPFDAEGEAEADDVDAPEEVDDDNDQLERREDLSVDAGGDDDDADAADADDAEFAGTEGPQVVDDDHVARRDEIDTDGRED